MKDNIGKTIKDKRYTIGGGARTYKKFETYLCNNFSEEFSIVYILDVDTEKITTATVTLETCTSDITHINDTFNNYFSYVKFLRTKEVSPMEIMNLTDEYLEYFV